MRALIGATLIDGTGQPTIPDSAILIDKEYIKDVGPRESVEIPDNTEIINVSGKVIMPGMIDCHDHLSAQGYDLASRWGLHEPNSLQNLRTASVLSETLSAGYTCVRDAGGLDEGFKMAVEEGLYPGPRLVLSIGIISPTGGLADRISGSGHGHHTLDPRLPSGVADGIDAIRSKVREMARSGADVIKFATTGGASSRPGHGPLDIEYTPEETRALVAESNSLGRKTMCHAVGGPGLRMCIEAGTNSVEHGCYLGEDPDLLKMMADNGIFFVPTFEVYEFHSTVSAPHMKARAQALMDIHKDSMHQALAAGVKVVAGTDAGGFVHGDNAREVELLVEKGMSNMQAIQATTGWAAECVGLEHEIGTISAGKLADLLILDGDPLKDISILRNQDRISLIMKNGEVFVDKLL
ncbi:MAG: amidohydrolase family protein [Chloroflexota bacterium]|nr:amidohydrolase family protein [Chloroflexota bacterium]